MGVSRRTWLEKHFQMRLPVQVVLCVLLSILIQQDRMKGNAKPTTTPLKEDPELYDLTDESLQLKIADKSSQETVKFKNARKLPLWKVLLMIVNNLSETKKIVSENKQNIEEIKKGVSENTQDFEEIKNANSALCAYQDEVGQNNGGGENNGLSGNIVVYDTTYLETNGANCILDKSTGKFTAGKSGVYQISVSAKNGFSKSGRYFKFYLRTSSGNYQDGDEAEISYQRAGSTWLGTPLSAIRFISLQQGETAWLEYECEEGLTSSSCGISRLKFCVSLYK